MNLLMAEKIKMLEQKISLLKNRKITRLAVKSIDDGTSAEFCIDGVRKDVGTFLQMNSVYWEHIREIMQTNPDQEMIASVFVPSNLIEEFKHDMNKYYSVEVFNISELDYKEKMELGESLGIINPVKLDFCIQAFNLDEFSYFVERYKGSILFVKVK